MDEALKKQQETDDDARFKAKRMVDFAQRDPRTLMAPDVSCSFKLENLNDSCENSEPSQLIAAE